MRLAAKAIMNPRTVERAYDGESIHDNTRARLREAALELGLPLPPEPPSIEERLATHLEHDELPDSSR